MKPTETWYGFDTENDPKGRVTLTSLVDESGHRRVWKRAGRLVEWIEKMPEGQAAIIVCHNLEYDLRNEFGDGFVNLNLNYLKNRLISARIGRVRFYDSLNHFRMTLAELGDAVGAKKLKFNIHDPEYVSNDAWIAVKAMAGARDYIKSLGGRIGATSGSSAMSVWEFMTEGEFIYGAVDTPWLRQGYYGGRTEIFCERAEGDVRGYDINSMYPYCMMDEYPEYLVEDNKFEKAAGMVEATVSVPLDTFVAPLPFRSEDRRLWYPVGTFTGTWTYDELKYAVNKCGVKIRKVHCAVGSSSLVRPFDEFILTLYEKRKQSTNPAERLFLKVLMNSLYGKIASRSVHTRTISRHTLMKHDGWLKKMDRVTWISSNRALIEIQGRPPDYINVCWGSMVTANARILLHRYMTQVPPDNIIYCDTDSVYVLDCEIPESKELGGMKLEKTASLMHVKQPKVYRVDDEYVAKGVPRPRKDDEGNIVINFAQEFFTNGSVAFDAPLKFRESLRSKRGKHNEWIKRVKSMQSAYTAKLFRDGKYYPPVIGKQMELFEVPSTKQPAGVRR